MIKSKRYEMWALSYMYDDDQYFRDRFCWRLPTETPIFGTALFKTRKLARKAKKVCCYHSQIEKVVVTIENVT